MKKKSKQNMMHIGSILNDSFKSIRTGPDAEMTRIWSLWENAVGETIARNAKPSAFKGHLLLVTVSSSTWMHHLNFLKSELMANINKALGSDMVRDLQFKIGTIK